MSTRDIGDVGKALRRNPYLGVLEEVHRQSLAEASIVTRYDRGQAIFREGDHADGVYLLLEGEVTITREAGGHLREVALLGPGTLFGVVALVDGTARSASCVATCPTRVARVPREVVLLLLNQSAPIAYAFQRAVAGQLARDLRRTDARLREVLARAAPVA